MNTLYPVPRKFSYNFACDALEKAFNPNYTFFGEIDTVFTLKHINDSVTFFYIDDELVAVYDEASGDLWVAMDKTLVGKGA